MFSMGTMVRIIQVECLPYLSDQSQFGFSGMDDLWEDTEFRFLFWLPKLTWKMDCMESHPILSSEPMRFMTNRWIVLHSLSFIWSVPEPNSLFIECPFLPILHEQRFHKLMIPVFPPKFSQLSFSVRQWWQILYLEESWTWFKHFQLQSILHRFRWWLLLEICQ